jgi:hypothetical protein
MNHQCLRVTHPCMCKCLLNNTLHIAHSLKLVWTRGGGIFGGGGQLDVAPHGYFVFPDALLMAS